MNINLSGKPILITGASSGIGLATAFACARAHMPVALMARRADRLHSIRDQITSIGGNAIVCTGSVDNPDDCNAAVDATVNAFGSIYAVFANAGFGHEVNALHMTDAELRAMFETNFFGSLNIIRPAAQHMQAARAGHILFCSSCLSKLSVPRYAAYSATKACQDHFARAMRHELASDGIHVSSVHPIRTTTEFFDHLATRSTQGPMLMDRPGSSAGFFVQSPDTVARAILRCLRSPRGEVWTSITVRTAMALAIAAPGLTDAILRRAMRKLERRATRSSHDDASSPS